MIRAALLAVLAVSMLACTTEEGEDLDLDSTLTIENDSSFTFIEINLAPVDQLVWGSDLLGSDVLEPGDVFEASGIECNTYDIRIIDDTSDECVLESVDLCLDDATWRIDDVELALCGF